jgi:RNA polymerase sigma factor (sigma-70 family)
MTEHLPLSLERQQWTHTSIRFVNSLQAGDDTAWRRVLTKTLWQVYAMGCAAGLRQHDCDELLQDVLLAASDGIDRFSHNGEKGALRAWLRAIARTKLCDKCRERGIRLDLPTGGTRAYKRLEHVPAPTPAPNPLLDPHFRDRLSDSMLLLLKREYSPENWEAFARVVINGEEPAAVAKDLHVSRNQIYKTNARILARLRDMMLVEERQ